MQNVCREVVWDGKGGKRMKFKNGTSEMNARRGWVTERVKVEFIFLSVEKRSFFSVPHLTFFPPRPKKIKGEPIDVAVDFER